MGTSMYRKGVGWILSICLGVTVLFSFAAPALARIVDDVFVVRAGETEFEMEIRFTMPLRYLSHRPGTRGTVFVINLRPIAVLSLNQTEQLKEFGRREILSWDRSIPIPLKELTYEGDIPDRPTITAIFTTAVEFEVRGSPNPRILFIVVRALPGEKFGTGEEPSAAETGESDESKPSDKPAEGHLLFKK